MAGLIRELGALRCDGLTKKTQGVEARQRYQIREASYRAAKSPGARLFLRLRQYVIYPLQLFVALLGQKIAGVKGGGSGKDDRGEICVVSTNTFYAPLMATYLHPNVVHLVYDLFPEAMIHSGKWREGRLKVKLVRWVVGQTFRRAACNVFLGARLKASVESIHGPLANAIILPVGADQALFGRSPKARLSGDSDEPGEAKVAPHALPTLLYCGNFGNMHDSATLFQFWHRLAESESDGGVAWRFHCSGPKRLALEATVRALPAALQSAITVRGGLSQADWVAAMESADLALVTMCPGAERVVMPSKTYSAMMAGQAILAIAPEDSDLVDLIGQANCGWWVAPGDVEGLAATVRAIVEGPDELLEKRENAYRYAQAHLGQDCLAERWVAALMPRQHQAER